ncbi:MAG: trypsin-like serine protease [Bacteroidales bacterium]|nr:trypsin-like serine protease [Bacteroidales bacterium]
MLKKYYFLLLCFFVYNSLMAQNLPSSKKYNLQLKNNIIYIEKPNIIFNDNKNCFGKVIDCKYAFFEIAKKIEIDFGTIYYCMFVSDDAVSFGFEFSNIFLQKSVELSIYNLANNNILISIANKDIKTKTIKTSQVIGDTIVIELFVPKNIDQKDFMISKIFYAFYNFLKINDLIAKAAYINNDFFLNYQIEKHAVCMYSYIGNDNLMYYCSGALINNTNFDAKPYFITATHCICSQKEAETIIAYFDYENGNSQTKTLQGAKLVEVPNMSFQKNKIDYKSNILKDGYYYDYDISLLLLNELPPKEWSPYYLGWNISEKISDTVMLIHHGNADYKQIAVSFSKPYQDSYPISEGMCLKENSFWHIDNWHIGNSSIGSSGAPLINMNKQIIGTLSGGFETKNDYVQMISKVWFPSINERHQLKHWLANDLDINEIKGYDPYGSFNHYDNLSNTIIEGIWNIDSTSIKISWKCNDLSNIKKFILYCNSISIKEFYSTDSSYIFNNITPNSKYQFYIKNEYINQDVVNISNIINFSNITNNEDNDIIFNQKKIHVDDFLLYPIPAQNYININSLIDVGVINIKIVNTKGIILKNIKAMMSKDDCYNIDLTDYNSGLYFILIESNNGSVLYKVLKGN